MTTPFPLLRLPRLALIPILQHMEIIEIIAFSLISKRAFNLSKCFCKVSLGSIDLLLGSYDIEMRIDDLTLFFFGNIPETVRLLHHDKLVQWKKTGLSTKQWIQRILAVTKCSTLSRLILHGTPDYDVFSITDVVPKVSNLHIMFNCTNTFSVKALQILSPVTSWISLFKLPFSNQEEFQRFWMGNVERLTILNDDLSRFQFSIDDVLASNAVKLELSEVPLSLRELNRFFSSWLNKTSNHRLKHLSVKSPGHINEAILLDGLNATRFTEQQARHFQSISSLPVFTGGFEVRRIDGQLATITFGSAITKTFINFDASL
ncbi:hypothetical protein GCK72_021270 [Caenorhabditis remanei]|uniref:F-box domain-containing protein n=1 Tax=Caenorhabditis remanei TaxID=31234 RepID=A0A6A5GJB5_CAERE|nr:hypothetical protein GCK72_021270 [Caenorhabditis remanei]KAF1754706.1 hypothetical protein GCK72_021270 [Caenorhabditis remanei]